MTEPKLKRAVIKEELVALTGDYIDAIILNQFLYWSDRTRDVDRYIEEEQKRQEGVSVKLTRGWIYKSAEELADELMLKLSKSNMRRHIQSLTNNGWLDVRNNPNHKWDKTLQYRVNIAKIKQDLQSIGYSLDGYKASNDRGSKIEHRGSKIEHRTSENRTAIPEITTKNTIEITNEKDNAFPLPEKELSTDSKELSTDGKVVFETYKKYYKQYTGKEHRRISQDTIDKINKLAERPVVKDYQTGKIIDMDTECILDMIEKYFDTSYDCDRNINHFLDENIQRNLFFNSCYYG